MRYYVAQNRIVADHGLGAHWVGAPARQPMGVFTAAEVVATTPYPAVPLPATSGACPPPGYPRHTQDNGAGSCCVPNACVMPPRNVYAKKPNVRCIVPESDDPSAGLAQNTFYSSEVASNPTSSTAVAFCASKGLKGGTVIAK